MQAILDGRRRLDRDELERWLVGPNRAADARQFVLAVLRDMYADDRDVIEWLATPRPELRNRSANECLTTGMAASADVETLVIREWNER